MGSESDRRGGGGGGGSDRRGGGGGTGNGLMSGVAGTELQPFGGVWISKKVTVLPAAGPVVEVATGAWTTRVAPHCCRQGRRQEKRPKSTQTETKLCDMCCG
jgi:hypothetical protein